MNHPDRQTSPHASPDEPQLPDMGNEPTWETIVRLPSRVLFVSVALVQIAVEMAVTAAQDILAHYSGRNSD
jgi:hypothetical protein